MRSPDFIPPRYETKYLITREQADAVRKAIAPFCELDPFSASAAEHCYVITSLYLDTPHLGFWQAWQSAADRRFKLRVRRYGERLGDSPVFAEIKQRVMDVTVKHRVRFDADAWLARARDGLGETRIERDFCARRDLFRAGPTLLVRYEREAWKGVLEGYARVTFDSRLQYQATHAWTLDGDSHAWRAADNPVDVGEDSPRILLEVKFERDVARWMVDMMRRLELVRRGFSKYGVGVRTSYDQDARLDAARRESAVFFD